MGPLPTVNLLQGVSLFHNYCIIPVEAVSRRRNALSADSRSVSVLINIGLYMSIFVPIEFFLVGFYLGNTISSIGYFPTFALRVSYCFKKVY
jgi:hypothetical protein